MPGNSTLPSGLPGEVEDLDLAQHVYQVLADEPAAEDAGAVERRLAGRDDFRDVFAARLVDVHRHDALRRRVEVGEKEKLRPLVAEEPELVLEIADQLRERGVGRGGRLADQHLVLRIGAAADREDEILAVVRRR